MPEKAVDIQLLTHRYGEAEALHQISLPVEAGRIFGLLGPNGGGKTTLFRILSTLLVPSEGTARVFGFDTAASPAEVRRRLGTVFQQPALDGDLTVLENLRFQGALYGLHGLALRQRIDELLDAFGVAARRKDRIKHLSGGLQRRVDLARGLLHRPLLLLLDEPTTSLDPAARHAFWQALTHLRRQEGTTMMIATHLMEEAALCDQVGIIDRGRLAACGAPEALTRELGEETLWLETDDPAALRDRVEAQFGFDACVVGNAVQISHTEAHTVLGALYGAFGGQIRSAMIRKPTLEDVFMVHTGSRLDEPAAFRSA